MRADASPAIETAGAGTGSPAIALRGVVKRFGTIAAVDGVDLDVNPGEVFGLIGHNGAGKSTLFKLMLGLLAPTAGELRIVGETVTGPRFRQVRRLMGYLPENVVLWDNLTGLETLRFFARLKDAPEADCAPMLAQVGLAEAQGRPVREYSKGMRQRLGFAQALLGQPRVLFLDEPTTGLDPHAIRAFWDTLALLRELGVTMVISSHILAELQHRVDRLAVMVNGRIEALGTVQQLREQKNLPLQVTVTLPAEDLEAAAGALRRVQVAWADLDWHAEPHGLLVRCPRAAKVPVLQAMAALGGVLDIQVVEPTLEDLFFSPASREADS